MSLPFLWNVLTEGYFERLSYLEWSWLDHSKCKPSASLFEKWILNTFTLGLGNSVSRIGH